MRSTTTSTAISPSSTPTGRDDDNALGRRKRLAALPDARIRHRPAGGIFQLNDLPEDLRKSGNLIVVGTPKNLPTTQPARASRSAGIRSSNRS